MTKNEVLEFLGKHTLEYQRIQASEHEYEDWQQELYKSIYKVIQEQETELAVFKNIIRQQIKFLNEKSGSFDQPRTIRQEEMFEVYENLNKLLANARK